MNEEILTYNTPSSEEVLRQIHQYEFKRLWKHNLTKNNKNLLGGVTTLIFAIIFFLSENYGFSGLFSGVAIATIINYISYYSLYRKRKKKISGNY